MSVPEREIKIICCPLVFILSIVCSIARAYFIHLRLDISFWWISRRSFLEGIILNPSLLCPWTGYFGVASLWGLTSPVLFILFSRVIQSGSKPSTFVQKTLFLVPCLLVGVIGGVSPKA